MSDIRGGLVGAVKIACYSFEFTCEFVGAVIQDMNRILISRSVGMLGSQKIISRQAIISGE